MHNIRFVVYFSSCYNCLDRQNTSNMFVVLCFIDIGLNGEIPKLYCTNLPENCKANDLQRLFSSFGHVIDCVILWDYYAFITYKSFVEAERALLALNGFAWKDRHLIVEWSRASGRRLQQQQDEPLANTSTRLNSFNRLFRMIVIFVHDSSM
jgi:RNA recognition motif-containing protein